MGMITFGHRGSFKNTEKFLKNAEDLKFQSILARYAQEGLNALVENTPVDTGLSADSWSYEIRGNKSRFNITWSNSNVTSNGTPVVILLQYGHGTNGGGFVEGYDFINPVMKPIFDRLSENLWEEVTKV